MIVLRGRGRRNSRDAFIFAIFRVVQLLIIKIIECKVSRLWMVAGGGVSRGASITRTEGQNCAHVYRLIVTGLADLMLQLMLTRL